MTYNLEWREYFVFGERKYLQPILKASLMGFYGSFIGIDKERQ
jgi:hypothetical protein